VGTDLDRYTPDERRVFERAAEEWRKLSGFTMETYIEILDRGLDPETVSVEGAARAHGDYMRDWYRKRGIIQAPDPEHNMQRED
jgi:hypothetical protein